MNEFVPPAGYEIMAPAAQEKARRTHRARDREAAVVALGPRALGPGDGLIEPTAWEGKPIPARKWIVPRLIPCNTVTLLTGNGGDGKSLLAVQLLKSSVTSTRWLGRDVKRVRCCGVFAEDDSDELMRRTDGALTAERLSFGDLDGLTYVDREGLDSIMYEADHNDTFGRTTAFFAQVWQTVQELGAELLVLDSLYNFFGGNENVRSQVNQFIGELKRMAKKLGCAIVLVAHPSRAGMGAGGDGTAGNTAWHNAVRARLYLHRKKHPSGDPDQKGPLVLEHMKSNYGKAEDAIEIMWEEGRFVPVIDPYMSTPPSLDDRLPFGDR
jgi:RecA-family ATPase